MRINHNLSAMNTYSRLTQASTAQSKSLEKLSSGLRINKAGDDAAGLAISEKMRGQIKGLDQAVRNAQDGISLIQTAEGALSESHSILNRMRELSVQAANDTNTSDDRAEIQKEMDQLTAEVTRISTNTEFNTKKLLNGDMGKTFNTTANTLTVYDMQVTGSDITDGTYTLTATTGGTDTTTVNTKTAATALVAGDITVANNSLYGDYDVTVTNYDGATADLSMIGPDGTQTTVSGAAIDGAAVAVGNITFDFSTNNITGNGSIQFAESCAAVDVDLSGAKTVDTASIASYTGESLNIGGFQFTLRTGHGADATVNTMAVTDNAVKFQIGANKDQNTSLAINSMSASSLSIDSLDVSTQAGANSAIETIDTAIKSVSSERSKLGAIQNRLEHTINNLNTSSENLTAAESRVRDVDMAKEMMSFTKNNILSQAATSMMAQANQMPQSVLQLLR